MLFLREIAAFLQLTIMPGAVVLGVLRPGFGKVRSLLLIPGISLPVNYIFTASALAAGGFRPALVVAYTAAVWLAAIWLWRKELYHFLFTPPEMGEQAAKIFGELAEWFRGERGGRTLLFLALAGGAAGVFFYLLWFCDAVDNIFTCWDSALSWNVWAESWARGKFPANVSEYPQLLPMNWALAYQLIGGPIQFVPKASISIFPLLTVLFFLEYGISRKKVEMVLTVPILSFYFANVDYLSHGGELDLLVAYWSAAVFFSLLYSREALGSGQLLRRLCCAVILTAGAGATKQAGLFMLCAAPFMALVMLRDKFAACCWTRRKIAVGTAGMLALCLLVIAPWYLVTASRIRSGADVSKIRLVTKDIYGGKSYGERLLCSARLFMLTMQGGVKHIPSARWARLERDGGRLNMAVKLFDRHVGAGMVMFLLDLLLMMFFLKNREYRAVSLVAVLFFFIWVIFFCYDLRNLSLAIPFIALITAGGAVEWNRSWRLGSRSRAAYLAAAAALLALLYPENFLDGARRYKFNLRRMEAGSPELNRKLYEWCERNCFKGGIVTDYEYLRILPGMEGVYRHADLSLDTPEVFREYQRKMAEEDTAGVLLPSYAGEAVKKDVLLRVSRGELYPALTGAEYTFYAKRKLVGPDILK